ncbi:hypothetical protein scyTo_0012749 [Scyliorhinus torazame]|uniref:Reverse transcriptase domain-containing protein n=1 Tax=Scyliorhinus torazame TaxID=75743 RepID=A0A401NI01_SCYTO|nr:hypothetical protein [Scyliorhinus torazame]
MINVTATKLRNPWSRGTPCHYQALLGKVFVHVTLTRLQMLAFLAYPESQCSFREGRTIADMIFSQEKCSEELGPVYIDRTKAFGIVS